MQGYHTNTEDTGSLGYNLVSFVVTVYYLVYSSTIIIIFGLGSGSGLEGAVCTVVWNFIESCMFLTADYAN